MKNLADLGSMPLRAPNLKQPTRLDSVVHISHISAPTEVDHYQIRRTMDVYVSPTGEDLSRVYAGVQKIVDQTQLPENMTVTVRGSVQAMRDSFKSFGLGLILSVVAGLFDSGGAVPIVRGSVPDSAGRADRG